MSILQEISDDLQALGAKIKSALQSPAAQTVEAATTEALEKALDDFLIAELARLGVNPATLTATDLPALLGTLGSTLIATIAAKLTAKIVGPTTAPTTPTK